MKNPPPSFPIILTYLMWVCLSFLIYLTGNVVGHYIFVNRYLIFSMAFLYLLLGSILTGHFMTYSQPYFMHHPYKRMMYIVFFTAISFFIYACLKFGWINSRSQTLAILSIINTANLLVIAILIGSWMVMPLKRSAEIIILCVVMSWADLFSIISGPSRIIAKSVATYYKKGMTGPVPAGDFLLFKIAVPGLKYLQPIFGASDWIAVVFLSAAAIKFGINDNIDARPLTSQGSTNKPSLYFPMASLGLLVSIVIADFSQRFIPALPIMSLWYGAFLLFRHPSARRLTRSDWRLMIIFSAIMLTVFIITLFYNRLV